MGLKIAVQMDPVENINPRGDTTFALMLEAQSRGMEVYTYSPKDLILKTDRKTGTPIFEIRARRVFLRDQEEGFVDFQDWECLNLQTMDVLLVRQDPPFDMSYLTATYLLDELSRQEKAPLMINKPSGILNAPEKLAPLRFPGLFPPTLISRNLEALNNFREEWKDIILKPLYGNGGAGIFRIRSEDGNFSSLLEMFFSISNEPLILQRYEPAVRKGDKRIILIDGDVAGAVNRVPAKGSDRSNLHVGGRAEATKLTRRELEICEKLGPFLRQEGLLLTGIDVIGDWLTEINVTSPTGIREISTFNNVNIAGKVWDSILSKLKK
ncbi:glutathione synthase [Acetobacteraceae bacterium]|nr:glutathione synthase [Acetobacteraceae bacterium]